MSATTDYLSSTQCAAPALRTNIAVSGLLTACDADIPLNSEVQGIYKNSDDFRLMSAPFLFQWEAKACQAKQNKLFDFIVATRVNLSKSVVKENLPDGLLDIRPYVKVKRKGPINNNYWAAAAGALSLVDGTLDAAGTYWSMQFSSPTGIPLNADWFLPPEWVFIESLDGDGNMIKWAGEIVKRTLADTYITVVLKPQMGLSSLPTARKANPVSGLATRGVGNINKFKSWCLQPPGLITGQLDPYWLGWARTSFKTDSSYEKWLKLVLADNQLYRDVFHLPTMEYNKQVAEDFQAKHVESFMNNTPLAGQTEALYSLAPGAGGLPLIETGEDSPGGVRCVGREANPIGVFEQHAACYRTRDLQGNRLNLPALFQALYKMMRVRKASGSNAASQKTFEIGMPQSYFQAFHQGMLEIYDRHWKGKLHWNLELIGSAKVAPMGWLYYEYPLLFPVGCTIRVILDDYFDDYASAMADRATQLNDARYNNLGIRLWIIDWSRLYMGIADSKTTTNSPGSNMQLAQNLGVMDPCRMETIQEYYTLRTWFWTAVVDCPSGNLILQNISAEVPNPDAAGVDYDASW